MGGHFASPTAEERGSELSAGREPLPFYPQHTPDGGGRSPSCRAPVALPGPAPQLPLPRPRSLRGAGLLRKPDSSALLRSEAAGRLPPPCPGLPSGSGGSCCSLPFCSLAPEKTNLLLRSDSAAAPCLRPARADVSRSSPRRSIGPAGRGAPALQALVARHRGPGVSQQRPARAAPLGRRQH